MRTLVTGASGFIGSHILEYLMKGGHCVTALVRHPDSTRLPWLSGVRVVAGDLRDPESLRAACRGQNCVIHAAGLVGDGGGRRDFQEVVVRGTEHLTEAACRGGVTRFVHMSSVAVYDTREGLLRETTPLASNVPSWNHYMRAKICAENVVWQAQREGKLAVTVLRPSVTIGPRDRHTTPRILRLLRSPWATFLGEANNLIPCVVAEELAAAVGCVASSDAASGSCYNLSGSAPITQFELLRLHAAAAGWQFPKRAMPKRSLPGSAALAAGAVLETWHRLMGHAEAPPLSRFVAWVAGSDCEVEVSRAASELGWQGRASYAQAIQRSVRWLREGRRV